MKIELIVTGADKNEQGLRALRREIPLETQIEVWESNAVLESELMTYPPERQGSKYVRTFGYQRDVEVVPKITTWGAEIKATQYAPQSRYLRGDLEGYGGAWMHRGRWKTLTAILESFLNGFINRLVRRLERLILRVMG